MRTSLWLFLLFGLLLIVGLLVPSPFEGRLAGVVGDSVHGFAFAVFAWLLYRLLVGLSGSSPRGAAWIVCVSLIVFGVLTEVAQYFVGRSFSIKDIASDSLGAVAGTFCAIAWTTPEKRTRRKLVAAAAGLLLVGLTPALAGLVDIVYQYRDFPTLASFEQPLERLRWRVVSSRMRRSPEHATDGKWSARVDLQPGDYSGFGMTAPAADWTGYQQLVFDVTLDEGPPVDVALVIGDRPAKLLVAECFERRLRLEPGLQQIVIPLADVERGPGTRRFDMTRMDFIWFAAIGLKQPRTLFLDHLRLGPTVPPNMDAPAVDQ